MIILIASAAGFDPKQDLIAAALEQLAAAEKKVWKEFLDNLAPLPTGGDPPIWIRALPPIFRGRGDGRPDANTMPQWFFDLCTLENDDAETMKIANATMDGYLRRREAVRSAALGTSPALRPAGIPSAVLRTRQNAGPAAGSKGETPSLHQGQDALATMRPGVLSKVCITAAMMGRADAVRYLLPNQLSFPDRATILANRMDQREGAQTTNAQRLGRVADTLHNALIQSVGSEPAQEPVIRVFPAWPKEWDASFTLLAPNGTNPSPKEIP